MKVIIFLVYIFFQNHSFIDKITGDFRDNGKFITLNLSSPTYSGKVIIHNSDFYVYCQLKYGYSKTEYKNFVKALIINNKTLNAACKNLDESGFIRISKTKRVDDIYNKGLPVFIQTYFNVNSAMTNSLSDSEKAYVVSLLFLNNRSCFIDDETGLYILNK